MSHEPEVKKNMDDKSQWIEEMPYFIWTIKDITSESWVKSPSFTISGVKFGMRYVTSNDICSIRFTQKTHPDAKYLFKTSVSVLLVRKPLDLNKYYFTHKGFIRNSEKYRRGAIIWMLEEKKLNRLVEEQQKICKNNSVSFLCVFGRLVECEEDVRYSEGTWCASHCLKRLLDDLQKLPTDILLKCGKDEIKAHKGILSARSGKFADIPETAEEMKITDMTFEVLDNLITYIYNGRIKCCRPSEDLMIELYEVAVKYRVESLKIMASYKLVAMLDNLFSTGKLDTALCGKLITIAKGHFDLAFQEEIAFCQKKHSLLNSSNSSCSSSTS